MHLAREANRRHAARSGLGRSKKPLDRANRGLPPVFWPLLGPTGFGRRERVRRRRRRSHGALLVDQKRLRAARADVEPDEVSHDAVTIVLEARFLSRPL